MKLAFFLLIQIIKHISNKSGGNANSEIIRKSLFKETDGRDNWDETAAIEMGRFCYRNYFLFQFNTKQGR